MRGYARPLQLTEQLLRGGYRADTTRGRATLPLWPRLAKFISRKCSLGCDEWIGGTDHAGWPRFYLDRDHPQASPRRIIFALVYGAAPPVRIESTCHTKLCVRPDHMRACFPRNGNGQHAPKRIACGRNGNGTWRIIS